MLSHSRTVSRGLILISVVLSLHHVSGRYVKPITFGYELGTPLNDILPVVSDQVGDLSISAAEPRPVIVELVKAPLSLPLVADAGTTSAQSDAPVISASEKVVKVLRKPMAFSYTNQADQANAASDHVADSPKEPLQGVESKHRVDQQPAAIDYYKYLARLQGEEKDGGAAVQKDGVEAKKEEGQNKDGADLRQKSKPNLFLNHSPTHFHSELAHKPVVDFHKSHYEAIPTVDAGGKAEASESHEEQEGGHADSQGSGSTDGHKEEIQASASHHGGGGGNYKRGGGRESQSVNKGEFAENGEKKYSGHHVHEKGEKGHRDRDGHLIEYQEDTGQKHGHQDEDGYEAEQHHGEEGQRATKFQEDGEHSKGHSTQGEHNVHKKDEYEKKQEFYDESHEGGEHEKHGEYFHEDDYQKGGHHKSEHNKGGEHQEHYGAQKQHEEGGHEHEDKGHKEAVGREVHHDHQENQGDEGSEHGGKRWQYEHGSSNAGDDDSKGAHTQVVVKDGDAQASNHGQASNQGQAGNQGQADNQSQASNQGQAGNQGQASNQGKAENKKSNGGSQKAEAAKVQSRDPYSYTRLEDFLKTNNHDLSHEAANQATARLQLKGGLARKAKPSKFAEINHGLLYGAETRPQKAEHQPSMNKRHNYVADSVAHLTMDRVRTEKPFKGHVHANGQIFPENSHVEAAPTNSKQAAKLHSQQAAKQHSQQAAKQHSQQAAKQHSQQAAKLHSQQGATPTDSSLAESHAQESAPRSHILVVGSDGNIYGLITNSDALLGGAA